MTFFGSQSHRKKHKLRVYLNTEVEELPQKPLNVNSRKLKTKRDGRK